MQAQAIGISARQFRAFDKERLESEFDIPGHCEVLSIAAFGVPASSDVGGHHGPSTPARPVRRPIDQLLWLPLEVAEEG